MNWLVVPIFPDNTPGVPGFVYRIFGYTYTCARIYDHTQIVVDGGLLH